MADKSPMHLSEFFKSGELFTLEVPDHSNPDKPFKFELWLQKPNPLQQDAAMKKARAKQARIRQKFRDETSDEYLGLREEVEQLGGVEELVDTLLQLEEAKLRQQAYQEVLYSEEVGSDWGTDGKSYLDLLAAIKDRYDEIMKANESLAEEDKHLAIKFQEDEELLRLNAEEAKFEEETAERTAKLLEIERSRLHGHSTEALRQMLFKRMTDTEAGLAWLQEYRMLMLFNACRRVDNHKRLYFDDLDRIWELPDYVRTQLMDAYNNLDQGLDDIKNSLSLLRS
jgi:hypothetical protein